MASRSILGGGATATRPRAAALSAAARRGPVALNCLAPSLGARAAAPARCFSQSFIFQNKKTKTEDQGSEKNKSLDANNRDNMKLFSQRVSKAKDPESASQDFPARHIGPRGSHVEEMLRELGPGAETIDSFIRQVVPQDVIQPPKSMGEVAIHEDAVARVWESLVEARNRHRTWMNGGGYYAVTTPGVIRRNVLENPAWYTSYTPYQAEVSQGRLESLLNFQTMVSDLTGLPVANASLLDEGTAAAEAMTLSLNSLPSSRAKRPGRTYVVSDKVHKTSLNVMKGRAEGFGINLVVLDLENGLDKVDEIGEDLVGVLVQYPDATGGVSDFRALADVVHKHGALLSAATDLSALTLLTPPGEWGADVALGNSQRFGVPLGWGGPHAAFMAVKESSKRRLPGRLVGVSKDRLGRRALRLALQTREQHIRREKATSNVCTAQALLANMAAMYAIYLGPEGLKQNAVDCLRNARMVAEAAQSYGLDVSKTSLSPDGQVLFDTVCIRMPTTAKLQQALGALDESGISCAVDPDRLELVMALPIHIKDGAFVKLVSVFHSLSEEEGRPGCVDVASTVWQKWKQMPSSEIIQSIPDTVRRTSSFLTHPVFNSHHSETEMLRYIHHLQSKDLSLVHSMIPLGSCTMKLNGTRQMELLGTKSISMHPHAPRHLTAGWRKLLHQLSKQLSALTGMDATSLQPNSGAQGEFAGLRVIRQYHVKNGHADRDICLIPVSAHGTNPASAAMAGMRVVLVKCEPDTGNLDLADLEAKCEQYASNLGAIMITYPSTYGVFEPHIKKVCNLVHEHGGLVYMDGANMNAQIGITSPGSIGADVCHLNLHKTFCIPHGGGGPGVGPICVKEFLSEYLPNVEGQTPVASANQGSAGILPISWAYIRMMGDDGLRKATEVALLNANYLLTRLKPHYPILYTNKDGRCAHEFIIDARPFRNSAGIEASDIAKRLQDYGFHAPTMSWPVPNTLMIEPTESESKEELDRFVDAMVSIREEIRDIEEGRQPREGNVLRMAPHPQLDIVVGDSNGTWERPYSRETAAYPLPWLKEKKFWPSVARVDDAYGDTNLFCTCPPIEDYVEPEEPKADA